MSQKPWLYRTFHDGKKYSMSVGYICGHIARFQQERLSDNPDSWTLSKEKNVEDLLDLGIPPDKIFPIDVALHPSREEFSVGDGITRLRVFRKRGIESIVVKMYHG